MLHAKIIDIKKEKIELSNAEKFIASSKYGASIYFVGTVRNINNNKNKQKNIKTCEKPWTSL